MGPEHLDVVATDMKECPKLMSATSAIAKTLPKTPTSPPPHVWGVSHTHTIF